MSEYSQLKPIALFLWRLWRVMKLCCSLPNLIIWRCRDQIPTSSLVSLVKVELLLLLRVVNIVTNNRDEAVFGDNHNRLSIDLPESLSLHLSIRPGSLLWNHLMLLIHLLLTISIVFEGLVVLKRLVVSWIKLQFRTLTSFRDKLFGFGSWMPISWRKLYVGGAHVLSIHVWLSHGLV